MKLESDDDGNSYKIDSESSSSMEVEAEVSVESSMKEKEKLYADIENHPNRNEKLKFNEYLDLTYKEFPGHMKPFLLSKKVIK